MIPTRTLVLCLLAVGASRLAAQEPDPRALERDILRQLVEINTSDSAGQTRQAAEAMARRLLDAGLPAADVRVIETTPGHCDLVARYRGRPGGLRPILLLAHLDVVAARREDWSFPPFELREQDGYYYGRGTSDDKDGVTDLVAAFIRYRREGFVPDRDLILVLTADEETSSDGIKGLLSRYRGLVDAEYALNTDAGGGELREGRPVVFSVQTAEKVYLSFQLEVRNRGGHSSLPEPDNAIYRLAAGLERLARFAFPVRLNETTRAMLAQGAAAQPPALAADMRAVAERGDPAAAARLSAAAPFWNAQLRTTCVATRLFGGHADNALPQLARATVNCRMLPDDPPDSVEATLRAVLADTAIHLLRVAAPTPSAPSPLRPDVMGAVERLVARMWPGAVIVPEMSTGATDGLHVRNAGIPVYGVSAAFAALGDTRAHGRDERLAVQSFHDAAQFWYELVKALATPAGAAGATAGSSPFTLGADVSFLAAPPRPGRPARTYRENGVPDDEVAILMRHGWTSFRLRVFVSPVREAPDNSLENTIPLARRIKAAGATLLLDIHYSDTWADPQHQEIPVAWRGLGFDALEARVEAYSRETIRAFKDAGAMPDWVQVGNEITRGMLWPLGQLPIPGNGEYLPPQPYDSTLQWEHLTRLLKAGIRGVREGAGDTPPRIAVHIDRGGDWATTRWFFDHLAAAQVDYDIIAQSFYPPWRHGTLEQLWENLTECARRYGKDFLVTETGYGRSQRPDNPDMLWPITPQGRLQFLVDLVNTVKATPHGIGVQYWAPEFDLWNEDGSPGPGVFTLDSLQALRSAPGSHLPAIVRGQTAR